LLRKEIQSKKRAKNTEKRAKGGRSSEQRLDERKRRTRTPGRSQNKKEEAALDE
jgi:hypothetical protein